MNKLSTFSMRSWLASKRKSTTAVLLTVLALSFSACEKTEEEAVPKPVTTKESPTLKKLLAMGFDRQDIQDLGEYYLVEGDIVFQKEAPKAVTEPKPGKVIGVQDQSSTFEIVSYAKQPQITVRIDASFPAQWRATAEQAIIDWNSITHSRINLNLTTAGTADISISLANLNGPFGRASWPTGGNPGRQVFIDPSTPGGLLRLVLVHELGHTLGLRHTDEGGQGGVPIPGTPTQDFNSVMNSGGAPNQAAGWVGFSLFDEVALQTLYPEYYRIIARHGNNSLHVNGGTWDMGVHIVQWTQGNGDNELFRFVSAGGGYNRIIARHGNQSLHVNGEAWEDGVPLVQWNQGNGDNEVFRFVDVGGGYNRIIARHGDKSLHVNGEAWEIGVSVVQWTQGNGDNEVFRFEAVN